MYASTPFDFTLKVWSAYAGDILGSNQLDLIESYINRSTRGMHGTRNSLEQLAFQMVSHECLRVKSQDVSRWISRRFSSDSTEPVSKNSTAGMADKRSLTQTRERASLNTLVNSGFIFPYNDTRIGYPHPIFIGYLAACYLSTTENILPIQIQPDWIGKTLTYNYLAYFKDLSSDTLERFRQDDLLNEELLRVSRWLSLIPTEKTGRTSILRMLVGAINKQNAPFALRAKFMTSIALSGDQGSSILFRQLLKSTQANIRQLAALGCGLIRDTKAVDELSSLCQDSNPDLVRTACLALVDIGGKDAIEILISLLMQGNETSRRSSAEALANHPSEGHAILKEASQHKDLMVRRSAVYGLARIRQPWSLAILELLQLEDTEWIVRNAAIQCLEEIQQPNPHIPHPISTLDNATWLIEYAGRQGLSVARGEQAFKLVLDVLIMGTDDEKLAALEYLGLSGQKEAANYIYPLLMGRTGEIQEAAYQALWQIQKTGTELPLA
jgi:HEAT repeat protein